MALKVKGGRSLSDLESVVEKGLQGFIEVGEALMEIRDRRLYREQGFRTFETYCRKRWNWGRHYANRQIAAAKVARNLEPIGTKPKNEAQARELARTVPAGQCAVAQSVDLDRVSAQELKNLVREVRPEMEGQASANSLRRSAKVIRFKELCRQLAGMPQPVGLLVLLRELHLKESRARNIISECALFPWFNVEIIPGSPHCAYRFSIDAGLKAYCDTYTSDQPGLESPADFFSRLYLELRTRREQIEGARKASNWDLSAIHKVELVKLLDWVERELSTYSQSVNRREDAANRPHLIGQKRVIA